MTHNVSVEDKINELKTLLDRVRFAVFQGFFQHMKSGMKLSSMFSRFWKWCAGASVRCIRQTFWVQSGFIIWNLNHRSSPDFEEKRVLLETKHAAEDEKGTTL